MKAIVSFIRPTTVLKTVPIVQKNEGQFKRNFANREELVQSIQEIPPPTTYDTIMYVRCGCNREMIYETYDDIPASNVTCVCGQLVIVYEN
jgi:hypothetical protein